MDAERSKYIDVEDGLKRVAGNEALYKKLLGIFTRDDHYAKISAELDSGELETAARSVHALKGVSANLSLVAVSAASIELEGKLKNNLDYADSLENLKLSLEATLEKINEI